MTIEYHYKSIFKCWDVIVDGEYIGSIYATKCEYDVMKHVYVFTVDGRPVFYAPEDSKVEEVSQ